MDDIARRIFKKTRKKVVVIIKLSSKGQLISKANCQAVNSSQKRVNEFVFTTMRRVFGRFLEEIEVTKKTFQNHLTFRQLRKGQMTDFSCLITYEINDQENSLLPHIDYQVLRQITLKLYICTS